ncbi:unnamed protein product [Clonostachys byssicola]|uniref:von Willebrand factor A domain-containing protein 5A n=1 Tax=Clonostachys byssicola TaxID=160290 RepID=A0A9N9UZV0_9HYPO|nr:unnamed protein product [Clonostachys byssicola]
MADEQAPECGCYIIFDEDTTNDKIAFIPLTSVEAHTTIQATASQTRLTQYYINPNADKPLDELNYVFPLYDGVSVVSFVCTIGDRVIRGVVKERQEAQATYDKAVKSGKVAGLLQKSSAASDVFSTTIGNVPAGAEVKVEITYLAELKHDAEFDGIRFTLPTHIAPRYGPGFSLKDSNVVTQGSISITVDADMPDGCSITSVQSPSHPISIQIGRCSTSAETAEPSLQKASASLALGSASLEKDFILHIVAPKIKEPSAVLETHPTLPNQQAIMATLVPQFKIPSETPEMVFLCDRSGSMYWGQNQKMPNLQNALNIFLRSLPVGVKFNICCFGTRYDFLWPESRAYEEASLEEAFKHVGTFNETDYGGTEMCDPLEEVFRRRQKNMNLEVLLLTDGDISNQNALFKLINENMEEAKGGIRLFTLGIGDDASHALIEGAARAGNGFAQTVGSEEKMNHKVVRMLKGALTPHIYDYSLEVKYERTASDVDDDDFVLVEKTLDSLAIEATVVEDKSESESVQKTIPIYDASHNDDDDMGFDDKPKEERRDPILEISTPKYLQTPCPVPALFPFNRTTVYVLISDQSPSLVAKSVLLKGITSVNSNGTVERVALEQEIPITALPGQGTTIHQLAAQKEVTELDEGRGWLSLAKDAETGTLIKDKFPAAQVQDMRKREAVRLCLRYQVAGVHCSMVAVDESQETEDNTQRDMIDRRWGLDDDDDDSDEDMGFGLFDGGTPPQWPSQARFLCLEAECEEEDEDSDEEMGFGLFDDGPPLQPAPQAVVTEEKDGEGSKGPKASENRDALQAIAALQKFTGCWEWDKAGSLERLLGVTKDDILMKAEGAGLDKSKDAVLATLCALVFLETKLAEEEDAWELMADKAQGWAAEQLCRMAEYERWKAVVRALL